MCWRPMRSFQLVRGFLRDIKLEAQLAPAILSIVSFADSLDYSWMGWSLPFCYSLKMASIVATWAFQYPIRCLIVRSHKVLKLWDLYLKLYDSSEIGQAQWQQCWWCACQIRERCNDLIYQFRGFETSQDLMIRCLIISRINVLSIFCEIVRWMPQYLTDH